MSAFEHTIESVVRGFHVYKAIWVPVLDEVLQAKQEFDNEEDQYAVAVVKTTPSTTGRPDEVTVGHVPRSISRMCWYFIQHDGEITCKVTGRRRRSDLPQGGMEVPCEYKFIGKKKHIKKIRKLLKV